MQYIKKCYLSAALLIAFTGFGLTQANAQVTVKATGTVLQPIQMTGTNLNFGNNIFPGLDKKVSRSEAEAAQFDISGEAGMEVTAAFTLPSGMSDGSGNSLPITFGSTDGGYAPASTDQTTASSFDPNSPFTTTLDASGGNLYLWLGGTVTPARNQPAGTYEGDITLDIAYTGN